MPARRPGRTLQDRTAARRSRSGRAAVAGPGGHYQMDVIPMSGAAWGIGLGILYLVLIFTLAIMSFRKGHWVLGLIGFIFPVLWVIGAILPSRYRRA